MNQYQNLSEAISQDTNWAHYEINPPLPEEQVIIQSIYLTMQDGVKIALSWYLPLDLPAGKKLPTILFCTRYWRAKEKIPASENIRCYLANGYSWVSVDARGTGASYGYWSGPWSPEEIQDYDEVINWIVAQTWSNGRVGTLGVSYNGTTAEMIVANGNPAVKAAMPKFSLFDALPDVSHPGGILLERFHEGWAAMNSALDRNELKTVPLGKNLKLQTGVLPVDADADRKQLAEAVAEHVNNYHSYRNVIPMRFRDDYWDTDPSRTLVDYMPCGQIQRLKAANIPLYACSGYGDGAYALSAIHLFQNVRTPGSRLVLGPWSHGGGWHIGPQVQARSSFKFAMEEMRFFDRYLKGMQTGIDLEAPVYYYTIGEEKWKTAQSFPPPGEEIIYYFGTERTLNLNPPVKESAWDTYQVTYTAGSGDKTRWHSLLDGGIVRYADRAEKDQQLLCYDSEPLDQDQIVTGIPLVSLFLSVNAPDADCFVYLEEVDPSGAVYYVTEGQLKALHRKLGDQKPPYEHVVPYRTFERKDAEPLKPGEIVELVFHLFPVSYRFRKGSRIRVALAGADKDMFQVPHVPPPQVCYYRDVLHPSRICLSVER